MKNTSRRASLHFSLPKYVTHWDICLSMRNKGNQLRTFWKKPKSNFCLLFKSTTKNKKATPINVFFNITTNEIVNIINSWYYQIIVYSSRNLSVKDESVLLEIWPESETAVYFYHKWRFMDTRWSLKNQLAFLVVTLAFWNFNSL